MHKKLLIVIAVVVLLMGTVSPAHAAGWIARIDSVEIRACQGLSSSNLMTMQISVANKGTDLVLWLANLSKGTFTAWSESRLSTGAHAIKVPALPRGTQAGDNLRLTLRAYDPGAKVFVGVFTAEFGCKAGIPSMQPMPGSGDYKISPADIEIGSVMHQVCDDDVQVYTIDYSTIPTYALRQLAYAYIDLFKTKDQFIGDKYNPVFRSDLSLDDIQIDSNGYATIQLEGQIVLASAACDAPLIKQQLEQTALNHVYGVAIFVNGIPLDEVLAGL